VIGGGAIVTVDVSVGETVVGVPARILAACRSGNVTIVYVVGARPNVVKMAPVISELRRKMPDARHVIVHTGQHYDRKMSEIFFDDLDVPSPDHLLGVGSATHAAQTARVMERLEPVLLVERPDLVVVPGDVNSTLAAALVTVKLGIPLAHVESGLRSFDRTMPEEINRIVTDEFSEYLFLHSDEAVENLRAEGIPDERMHFVGNTMIDSLVRMESRFRGLGMAGRLGVAPGEYLLVTLHRPNLVDGPLLFEVLDRLNEIARELPVVFPVHPRTRKMMDGLDVAPGVMLLEPVGYLEFLSLEADAAAVLTDSGGVQEETTHLGVRCFTLRDRTERPVTIRLGTNTLLGLAPARISEILPALSAKPLQTTAAPPMWDGRAAKRVADVVAQGISGRHGALLRGVSHRPTPSG
jgi:UDP-N-acetylglucosamine 2-epimerase (non-hydrolysing)